MRLSLFSSPKWQVGPLKENALYVYEKLKFADIEGINDENLKIGCLIAIIYNNIYNVENDDIYKIIAGIFAFGVELRNLIPQIVVNGKPRFEMHKNPLNQFKDDDIICFIHAYDMLINQDITYLTDKFNNYNCDLLIGVELKCSNEKYINGIKQFKN